MRRFVIHSIWFGFLVVLMSGCGSVAQNSFDDEESNETVAKIEKYISFFAWDGIDGYERLDSRLGRYGNPTIYLNPVDDGEYKFAENTQILQSYNAKVWYLMSSGFSSEVYPSKDYIKEQIDKIVAYNQNHTQQVLGMSFDIEPWIDFEDQNSSDNKDDWQEYLDFMSEARDMLHDKGLKISISIPFWIDKQSEAFPNDRPINYDVIDIADEVIVMTYTIFADRVEPYAKTSLKYASSHSTDIKIALEMVENNQEDNVSFYTHPEDIKDILYMDLNYTTFKGYTIHTLDAFLDSGIGI